VVVWAHQTTGFTDAAAPSRKGVQTISGQLADLLARGYAVAAPDYEGLGTPEPLQYEVGLSAGHSVLDAARALRHVEPSKISPVVAVVGHSEGGHAALWAAQLARGYAAELDVRGAVASAPGANLNAILDNYKFSPETELNVLRLLGDWHLVYGLALEPLLTPAGIADAQALISDRPIPTTAPPFRHPRPSEQAPLRHLADVNTPGATRADAPILMLVGTADRQVPSFTNTALADRLRRVGDKVELRVLPGVDHDLTPVVGAEAIRSFLKSALG
jgi:pimeloyl-ACP methyl ester carboxylesterase